MSQSRDSVFVSVGRDLARWLSLFCAPQSPKQWLILLGVKSAFFFLLLNNIYLFAVKVDVSLGQQLTAAANILTGIWLYTNLLAVKIEVQEMLIPPFGIHRARELLIVAVPLSFVEYFL